jgi:aminopeptidase YwaD
MKSIFVLLLLLPVMVNAQKLKKADKAAIESLKASVSYLADDKLEGRRAGTPGENLAATYITEQFTKAGLQPKGENGGYIQPFSIDDGRKIKSSSIFQVNGKDLAPGTDFFPLGFSPDSRLIEAATSTSLAERNSPWFKDLGDPLLANKDNPHFDLAEFIKTSVRNAADKGASVLILYNTSDITDNLKFEAKDKSEKAAIPVMYITKTAWNNNLKDQSASYDFKIRLETEAVTRTAHNVAGYINNGAPTTIVFGAHFDHLGYGEDGNSMVRTGEKLIHNGADDNASGTAALIELAKMMKKSKLKKQNYLFLAFSGEELGLFGSKYYVEHPTVSLTTIDYMVNMDMVGRLNDSTKTITVGGFGTSPTWSTIIVNNPKAAFAVKIDSSGTGPSDHTSFYRKDIPVLFFFTGLHSDYHKPTDDANKINYAGEYQIVKYIYSVVEKTAGAPKLVFTKTREQQVGTSTRFSVTMGIMPDYTYSSGGVRVDGVSDGRPAQKAGIKAGDIVTQLGDYKISSVESYMQALGKFKKGDATKVTVKRGSEEMKFDIVF